MSVIRLGDAMRVWQQAQEIRFNPENRHLFLGESTGIESLDQFGRLHYPFYGVIVARQKAGKTALMLTFALALAKAGYAVYFNSLEMDLYSMCTRTASNLSVTDMNQYNYLKADQDDWMRTENAIRELEQYAFYMAVEPAFTTNQVVNDLAEVRYRNPNRRLVTIIDYLALMQWPGAENNTRKIENLSAWARALTLSKAERNMQELTPEIMLHLGDNDVTAVITASQIPAESKRSNGRVTIDSAMYSSVYGNDASHWWCINDVEENANRALPTIKEIDVGGRNMVGGTARVLFNGAQARYEDVPKPQKSQPIL